VLILYHYKPKPISYTPGVVLSSLTTWISAEGLMSNILSPIDAPLILISLQVLSFYQGTSTYALLVVESTFTAYFLSDSWYPSWIPPKESDVAG
jgi:hypothetical protein